MNLIASIKSGLSALRRNLFGPRPVATILADVKNIVDDLEHSHAANVVAAEGHRIAAIAHDTEASLARRLADKWKAMTS